MGQVTPATKEVLRSIPLFAACSDRELAAVDRAVDEVYATEGDVLIREGRFGKESYVIVEGEAGVTKRGEFLARLGPGDFFGELSMLDNQVRTATVTALTPMRLLVIHARNLLTVLEQGSAAATMLRTLAQRLRDADLAVVPAHGYAR
jgi:CRP/FNR family cyclic AMP-dependent transcriptional regulator